MFIKQLSIFVENRPGAVLEITDVLEKYHINLRALSIAETADYGVVRIIVNKRDQAIEVLKEAGFLVTITPVIAVAVGDVPGGLRTVLHELCEAGIHIEYANAFVAPIGDSATILLRCSEMERAVYLLEDAGYRVLTRAEIGC